MLIVGGGRIALVETGSASMKVEVFATRLELVKAVMDNGAIGAASCYGDEKHLAALDDIERHIKTVRMSIAKQGR